MGGLTKKGDTYYAVFKNAGKTVWKRIGKVSYRNARKTLRLWETEVDSGNLGIIETKTITFSAFIGEYMNYRRTNKADSTVERDHTSLVSLLPAFGPTLLEAINDTAIEKYKAKRLMDGVKPKTIRIELFCLSNILRKAMNRGYLRRIPKIEYPEYVQRPPRYLDLVELDLLINAASSWLRPILIILRNTGLRISELCGLQWSDVDFDNNILIIMNRKRTDYRSIPMTPELKATLLFLQNHYIPEKGEKVLARTKDQTRYVICHTDGSSIKSIRSSLANAARKAGLKGVSAHVLRHTFASHAIMNGMDINTLKELMGHGSITVTQIYTHLSPKHKAAAINKLPWADNKLRLVKEEED
jgi:site-specific recombinase XerD